MRRTRRFSKDDIAVWARVRSSVRPMRAENWDGARETQDLSQRIHDHIDAEISSKLPQSFAPIAIQKSQPQLKIDLKKTDPIASTKGMQRSMQRAVAKGRVEPDARIDLHGLRLENARAQFFSFLRAAAKNECRVALVVTGKGGHKRYSDFGHEISGVIRRALPEWINSNEAKHYISHYCPSHPKHGGEGAWYIFIRAAARR